MRDGLPLTRPTRWSGGIDSFEPDKMAAFKLFPGSANTGQQVSVSIYHCGWVDPRWINIRTNISIDGVAWPNAMPGQVFVDSDHRWPYAGWTCIVNFPVLSHLPGFAGTHTLLMRTVVA